VQIHPCILCGTQAEVELLHSWDFLQAVLQFAAHIQALTKVEHQLLAKSAAPLKLQEFQLHPAAEVVMPVDAFRPCGCYASHCMQRSGVLHGRHAANCEQDTVCMAHPQAPNDLYILTLLCQARVNLLDAAWIIMQRHQKPGMNSRLSIVSVEF
jgi:hypothetical protein